MGFMYRHDLEELPGKATHMYVLSRDLLEALSREWVHDTIEL